MVFLISKLINAPLPVYRFSFAASETRVNSSQWPRALCRHVASIIARNINYTVQKLRPSLVPSLPREETLWIGAFPVFRMHLVMLLFRAGGRFRLAS